MINHHEKNKSQFIINAYSQRNRCVQLVKSSSFRVEIAC